VVVVTGEVDVMTVPSSGVAITVMNGHPWQGLITGSGCTLGACIAACCTATTDQSENDKNRYDFAALAGLFWFNVAAEWAAMQTGCTLGSFQGHLIDGLHHFAQHPEELLARARYRAT